MNTASNLAKPVPNLRLRHRLGRVYKNCLGAATLIGKPAPTKIHQQFNENDVNENDARSELKWSKSQVLSFFESS